MSGTQASRRRVALVGPTASGKTAVGIALARALGGEILSADSLQVYRRMEIGTAKPTALEREQAVFHGLDLADPDQDWTLADFQTYGERTLAEIEARDARAWIVGGTGLYVRALTTNLDIPSAPPSEAIRARLRADAAARGNAWLHAEVARIDPQAAARIHGNDVLRLVRAWEVWEQTGVPLSEWHRRNRELSEEDGTLLYGLTFENRDALYARIEARFDQMLAEGLLDETRALIADYGPDIRPLQSLGYKQMASFLAGGLPWDAAVEEAKRETRRFAKRQMIWFRADRRVRWREAEGRPPEDLAAEIAADVLQTEQTG